MNQTGSRMAPADTNRLTHNVGNRTPQMKLPVMTVIPVLITNAAIITKYAFSTVDAR